MKKTLLAIAIMASFSGTALAQSSVVIYGQIDLGVAYKDAGKGKVTSLDSGLNGTSRLGFKGTESLGGGLNANFNLEMGLKADTGASDSALFARGAWVGLSSKEFGAVNFGRHKALTYIYGKPLEPFNDGLLGKTDLMFKINNVRDNSVTYISNNVQGFSAAAQYGFGEIAGNATAKRVLSAAVTYDNGPILASIVWDQVKDANGNLAPSGEKLMAGATYNFGTKPSSLKAHVMINEVKGTVAPSLALIKEQLTMVGISSKEGANTFIASFTRSKIKTASDSNSNRIALGYVYDLSKRTNLYTSIARVQNDKKVKTLADADGATARLFNVGIHHNF